MKRKSGRRWSKKKNKFVRNQKSKGILRHPSSIRITWEPKRGKKSSRGGRGGKEHVFCRRSGSGSCARGGKLSLRGKLFQGETHPRAWLGGNWKGGRSL